MTQRMNIFITIALTAATALTAFALQRDQGSATVLQGQVYHTKLMIRDKAPEADATHVFSIEGDDDALVMSVMLLASLPGVADVQKQSGAVTVTTKAGGFCTWKALRVLDIHGITASLSKDNETDGAKKQRSVCPYSGAVDPQHCPESGKQPACPMTGKRSLDDKDAAAAPQCPYSKGSRETPSCPYQNGSAADSDFRRI
jgi:hypothetical protein